MWGLLNTSSTPPGIASPLSRREGQERQTARDNSALECPLIRCREEEGTKEGRNQYSVPENGNLHGRDYGREEIFVEADVWKMALYVPDYDVDGQTRLRTLFCGDLPVDCKAQKILEAVSKQLEDPVSAIPVRLDVSSAAECPSACGANDSPFTALLRLSALLHPRLGAQSPVRHQREALDGPTADQVPLPFLAAVSDGTWRSLARTATRTCSAVSSICSRR